MSHTHLFHVRERLRGVANARFGGGDSEAKERQLWWRRRYARLRRGQLPVLLEELDALAVAAESPAELKRVAAECALYFRNHRRRMDYPRYRRLGLCSSSAPVESMCKHIVGKRLKGSGRRWSVENANAIASLRCTFENGEADAYFERRNLNNIVQLNRLRSAESAPREPPPMLKAA